MERAWSKSIKFSIHEASVSQLYDVFNFQFHSLDHAYLILCRGPWSYNNRLMVTLIMRHVDCIIITAFSYENF